MTTELCHLADLVTDEAAALAVAGGRDASATVKASLGFERAVREAMQVLLDRPDEAARHARDYHARARIGLRQAVEAFAVAARNGQVSRCAELARELQLTTGALARVVERAVAGLPPLRPSPRPRLELVDGRVACDGRGLAYENGKQRRPVSAASGEGAAVLHIVRPIGQPPRVRAASWTAARRALQAAGIEVEGRGRAARVTSPVDVAGDLAAAVRAYRKKPR